MALMGSLSDGVSALQAFTQNLDVLGNNIANVDTTGFKSSTVNFQDNFNQIYSQTSGASGAAPVSDQIGSGVSVADITSDFSQGDITSTGVTTNLAISGNGYFVVKDALDNTVYATRAGNFTTDSSGNILSPNGYQLQGLTGGSISYDVSEVDGKLVFTKAGVTAPSTVGSMTTTYTPPTATSGLTYQTTDSSAPNYVNSSDFSTSQINAAASQQLQLSSMAFDTNGNLIFTLTDGNSYTSGQVLLTSFTNQNALVTVGNNMYTNFDAAGPIGGAGGVANLSAANNSPGTNGLGTFETESLENSNVDLTAQLTDLISAERSFQAASRIITVSDDILQDVVDLKQG